MNKYSQEEIEKVINESPNMIAALEAVGAMYCIPSTHFISKPGLKKIMVEGDVVVAPADAKPNTKAVICAIGAVLDQISQRINDKLGDYQAKNIVKGRIEDKVSQSANPNKGAVISHHTLSDGSEIIVYDSGLIDMPHTEEARNKVSELRASGVIPNVSAFNDSKEYVKPSYFSKEDDISLTPEEVSKYSRNDPTETNIASSINESETHLEMCASYHDTDYLGYEIFHECGFDFVKMTEAFITEAAANKSKKFKKIDDIKHMKFDNTEITKAIQCFNEARDEQKNVGKGNFDIKKFIDHPKYNEGVKHLEKQFDCHLSIYWEHIEEHADKTSLHTISYFDLIAQNLYISKSKGFQLNGLPIQIHVINKAIDEEMTKNANLKLFGQFVCAGLCHEIFHNIANALRMNNGIFAFTLTSAMSLAESTNDVKRKREVFSRFVSTLDNGKHDPITSIQKKRLVNELCKASALASNERELNELKEGLEKNPSSASQEIDRLIKRRTERYNELNDAHQQIVKAGKKYSPERAKKLTTIGIILTCTVIGAPVGIPMMVNARKGMLESEYVKQYEAYLKTPNKEEFYCDLFAGMYNLPITFTIGYDKRNLTYIDASNEQLQQLTTIESKLSNLLQSQYPTLSERNYAAYTIAKNILESKNKVSKEVRDYCSWIVDNYSKIADTDIATNYRSHVFNPDEAKDLDQHLQNLINNNNIKVTEYNI